MDWGLLEHLSADERRRLLAAATRRRFEKGEAMLKEPPLGTHAPRPRQRARA